MCWKTSALKRISAYTFTVVFVLTCFVLYFWTFHITKGSSGEGPVTVRKDPLTAGSVLLTTAGKTVTWDPLQKTRPVFQNLELSHAVLDSRSRDAQPASASETQGPLPASTIFPADLPSNRCDPIPLKFPLHAPLFPCPWLSSLPPLCSQRLRARLLCRGAQHVQVVYEWVSMDTPPSAYRWGDVCLERAVRARCYENGPDLIPNLSHFVTFGGRPLRNYTFLAMLSAVRFLQPCFVFLHADTLPQGPLWDTLVRLLPHLIHVQRPPPKEIFGNKVKVIEHSSDIARLEAVIKFGGVYQDTDYLLLNSVDDVRNYSTVMGTTHNNYCNAVFLGKAGAEFLKAWYDTYVTFDDSQWGFHSTIVPYRLHRQRPELPFHEIPTLIQPYYQTIKKLFYDNFMDWKRLHGIHLYTRPYPGYFKERYDLRNSSLGQVTRHILFGDSEACFGNKQLTRGIERAKFAP